MEAHRLTRRIGILTCPVVVPREAAGKPSGHAICHCRLLRYLSALVEGGGMRWAATVLSTFLVAGRTGDTTEDAPCAVP